MKLHVEFEPKKTTGEDRARLVFYYGPYIKRYWVDTDTGEIQEDVPVRRYNIELNIDERSDHGKEITT